ncbi:transglycosylase SLT domain-containing protein [Streptomyces sp. R302]|uniref:LysM peptidoglycan-binding domain-containing protein n=1 Tax=unclassified Streptomyces TaxID=2593676 RepID=UPI00145E7C81|nr:MULTISPECIES: LysM peptidoglycan-binding domain-containing protein [unclassified Streptomyces]NML51886.1 transglycosylase SLT domain-containing protein [Streptomyces sp. R301]NML81506.1 transglycosylase SLT domain-containing protein [Streptomyces sp. R302]
MPAHGKHRRPRRRPVSRGLAFAGTGGVALALPLVVPATAGAEPVAQQAAPTAAVAVQAAAQAPAAPAASHAYTVVKGDSLSLIAHRKGIQGGWKSLYRANKEAVGDNPSLIHPGLELTIRRDSAKAATKPAAKPAAKSAPSGSAERASRSSARAAVPAVQAQPAAAKAVPAATRYADNLDGWIRESLDVMARYGIPGSYDGILRNVMRESSGNPRAINLWDSNAVKGTPSKGLLQVIDPTFAAYHVPGTSLDPYDPVANITAACNYAADRYGSIDNVNGAY